MSAVTAIKYRAFLSYSHRDTGWARWLHKRLEGFSLGAELIGRETPLGPVPATLRPIFRDREEFAGGHTLTDATLAALDQSAALIVLCSPAAAQSHYVNEEVRLFRWRHPGRPVVPVIIAGTGADAFPPALRTTIDPATGAVTDQPVTLLGPDLRETGDGRALGLAKAVAGMTGVGTDEIVRRAERDRRRQLRRWIAGLSAVIVALSGLTVWAEFNRREAVGQRQEAERNFALAKGAADGLVFDIARGLRDVEGMRAGAVAKILGTAGGTFDKLADAAPDNRELQHSRSIMLDEFGETYFTQGDLGAALASYRASLAIRERFAEADPDDTGWQEDLGVSHSKIGDVQIAQGDLGAALASYRAFLAIAERLTQADPGNANWQHDLSASHNKIGDVQRARGELDAALASYRAGFAIRERLVQAEPGNAGLRRDLSASNEKLGDILKAQGNLLEAFEQYTASLRRMVPLRDADTSNADLQRFTSETHNKIGDVQRAQGDLGAALASYQAGFEIRERLARSDPENAGWQFDLGISNERIGDMLAAQGHLEDALVLFQQKQDIAERLAQADPGNANWQRDLSVSHDRIGDMKRAQGDLGAALVSYRAGLAIRERLAEADPDNAGWQRDVAVSYWKLASFEPAVYWPKALAKLEDMERRGILLPADERFLATAKENVAQLP